MFFGHVESFNLNTGDLLSGGKTWEGAIFMSFTNDTVTVIGYFGTSQQQVNRRYIFVTTTEFFHIKLEQFPSETEKDMFLEFIVIVSVPFL